MIKDGFIVVGITAAILSASANSSSYECKTVGSQWVWFSNHFGWSITYHLVGPPSRRYELGTGVSLLGEPRGSRLIGEHIGEVTTYGAGSLHVRRADSGEKFTVCVTSTDIEPSTIYKREF